MARVVILALINPSGGALTRPCCCCFIAPSPASILERVLLSMRVVSAASFSGLLLSHLGAALHNTSGLTPSYSPIVDAEDALALIENLMIPYNSGYHVTLQRFQWWRST